MVCCFIRECSQVYVCTKYPNHRTVLRHVYVFCLTIHTHICTHTCIWTKCRNYRRVLQEFYHILSLLHRPLPAHQVSTCMYVCLCVYTCVYVNVNVITYVCVCISLYNYTCICIPICLCITTFAASSIAPSPCTEQARMYTCVACMHAQVSVTS
jgi:hypothetical protein